MNHHLATNSIVCVPVSRMFALPRRPRVRMVQDNSEDFKINPSRMKN